MHPSVLEWVTAHLELLRPLVLEVGSLNVNGSVRPLCPTPYIGIDVVEGPGVDLVYGGETIPFDDHMFATVMCTEVFEHARRPWRLAEQIVRVLQPGGHALITARGNGFPHHHPPDRWRYMDGTLSELFADLGCETKEEPDWYPDHPGVFVIAVKSCG